MGGGGRKSARRHGGQKDRDTEGHRKRKERQRWGDEGRESVDGGLGRGDGVGDTEMRRSEI